MCCIFKNKFKLYSQEALLFTHMFTILYRILFSTRYCVQLVSYSYPYKCKEMLSVLVNSVQYSFVDLFLFLFFFPVELLVYQQSINCSFQKIGAFAYLWQSVTSRHIKSSYVSHIMSEYKE